MIITYYGKQFFKIQKGDFILAINPISKNISSKIKITKFGADLALSSARHPDFSGFKNVTHGNKKPFLIYGPGEYEVDDVFVYGFNVGETSAGFLNTFFYFKLDGISVCFLGPIDSVNLDQEIKEIIDEVDILFVPIGGGDVLDYSSAVKITKIFEAKIIIPMDYGVDREKDSLKNFLSETGNENIKIESKLTIKKKDIFDKKSEIIVLDTI